MSGRCFENVWRFYGGRLKAVWRCVEGVWRGGRVSGGYLECVWKAFLMCPEGSQIV